MPPFRKPFFTSVVVTLIVYVCVCHLHMQSQLGRRA